MGRLVVGIGRVGSEKEDRDECIYPTKKFNNQFGFRIYSLYYNILIVHFNFQVS